MKIENLTELKLPEEFEDFVRAIRFSGSLVIKKNLAYGVWGQAFADYERIELSAKVFGLEPSPEHPQTQRALTEAGFNPAALPLWKHVVLHEIAHINLRRKAHIERRIRELQLRIDALKEARKESPFYESESPNMCKPKERKIKPHGKEFRRELVRLYKFFGNECRSTNTNTNTNTKR